MTEANLHEYEVVFVARPTLNEDGVAALNDRVTGFVGAQSGQVQATELWGKRTLAYPINKFYEGIYVLHRVSLPPQSTPELDRMLRYNEDVLRYLVVRTDE
jgi:small subunit ribosomal protein S6